ncbi:hypothetical protein LXL04_039531 [Taraxacum kok-saghyz]
MRWSAAAIADGDRPIPPGNGTAHSPNFRTCLIYIMRIGNGNNLPAKGSSGEQKMGTPADSRQPSLPRLSPVANLESKSAGAGKRLHDLDTHSGETEILPEREHEAAEDDDDDDEEEEEKAVEDDDGEDDEDDVEEKAAKDDDDDEDDDRRGGILKIVAVINEEYTMSDYLCEELIVEIFTRLPPKSLLRFRSLSKLLCGCIFSHGFIRMHTIPSPTKVILSRLKWEKIIEEGYFQTLHGEEELPLCLCPKHEYNGIRTKASVLKTGFIREPVMRAV